MPVIFPRPLRGGAGSGTVNQVLGDGTGEPADIGLYQCYVGQNPQSECRSIPMESTLQLLGGNANVPLSRGRLQADPILRNTNRAVEETV